MAAGAIDGAMPLSTDVTAATSVDFYETAGFRCSFEVTR
jgi:hypothetical protein